MSAARNSVNPCPSVVELLLPGGTRKLLPPGPLRLLAGSALRGVEFMLAFGLGTVPLLWFLQINFHWIRLKLPPVWIARVQTGLAFASAVIIAWRLRGTLGLPGPGLDHFVCH